MHGNHEYSEVLQIAKTHMIQRRTENEKIFNGMTSVKLAIVKNEMLNIDVNQSYISRCWLFLISAF